MLMDFSVKNLLENIDLRLQAKEQQFQLSNHCLVNMGQRIQLEMRDPLLPLPLLNSSGLTVWC